MMPDHDRVPLKAAEEQLRALPSLRRPPARTATRLGRWAAIAGLLAALIAGVAALAGTRTRAPRAVASASTAPTTATASTPPAFDYAEGVVETDNGRWALGVAGDVIALGDWDCDGVDTPALLRPSTGGVYAFNEWAAAGRDLVAEMLGNAPDATELMADDVDADGCDDVITRSGDGVEQVFRPADRI